MERAVDTIVAGGVGGRRTGGRNEVRRTTFERGVLDWKNKLRVKNFRDFLGIPVVFSFCFFVAFSASDDRWLDVVR